MYFIIIFVLERGEERCKDALLQVAGGIYYMRVRAALCPEARATAVG